MLNLIKPPKLQYGDTVALVSSSSGLAGEENFRFRTEAGIKQLEAMGFKVKVMPHALKGIDFNYHHPKERADDLMAAFKDPDVKAIISTLGGDDSIRLLPYIDYDIIRSNPKIYTGYSDSTVTHFICMKAGLSSFYGPALLTDFAENIEFPAYTKESIERVLMSSDVIGEIQTSDDVLIHGLKWTAENKHIQRKSVRNTGYEVINGRGTVEGPLIGGCVELFYSLRGTAIYPTADELAGSILFLETSEVHTPEWLMEDFMRSLGATGVLEQVNGIIVGRPQNGVLYDEYKAIIPAMMKEWGQADKPVFYNASFGHNEPKCLIPYGRHSTLDCEHMRFEITESAVR